MTVQNEPRWNFAAWAAITVAALGYFVDAFDMLLFSAVRISSLRSLGVNESELVSTGVHLLNMQLTGLLLGGILWGIYGDKRGRVSVLFGSIILYSLATLANAAVTDTFQYSVCRIIAGIGLAGELGAGITLVSESLPRRLRGIGTAIVATIGVGGSGCAGFLAQAVEWRTAFIIGGILGLVLLVLRAAVHESGLFNSIKRVNVRRGDFTLLFRSRERLARYITCILPGLPIWFLVGIVATFAPEIAASLGVHGAVTPGTAIVYASAGFVAGDLLSGLWSQYLGSRKRAIASFMLLALGGLAYLLTRVGVSAQEFYTALVFPSVALGYWAVFVTTAAEQFGTNLRATVTTTVPNFVRGAAVLMTSLFAALKPSCGALLSAQIVGAAAFAISTAALFRLRETFGRDLDFVEEDPPVEEPSLASAA